MDWTMVFDVYDLSDTEAKRRMYEEVVSQLSLLCAAMDVLDHMDLPEPVRAVMDEVYEQMGSL